MPRGAFNVAKCVEYLRSVGVEVPDATAQSWSDSESVHRFLKSGRRVVVEGRFVVCNRDHRFEYAVDRRKRKKPKGHSRCPECGAPWSVFGLRWTEARDGTIRDFRDRDERWKPLADTVAEDTAAQGPDK